MGSVRQAVLEFDEEVRAPWRPRLVPAEETGAGPSYPAGAIRPRTSRRSPSRVGGCRPGGSRGGGALHVPPGGRAPVGASTSRRSAVAGPHRVRPHRAGLRLTRRARRLAVALALAAGVALGSWLVPLVGGGGGDLRLAGASSVVVQPGDTLWSIAGALDGDGDVRAVVDAIQELNELEGTVLTPGQVLVLP